MDLRGSNSLYWNGEVGDVKLAVQYALDQNKVAYDQPGGDVNEGNQGFIDDNDGDMFSASAGYDLGPVTLTAAYANYSEIYGGEVEAWRAAAKYTAGAAKMGVIFENIDTDSDVAGGSLSRSAYGLFAQYRLLPKTTVGAQWMHADESDQAGGDDEADQFSLGLYQQIFPRLKVYTLATTTRNGDNGKYRTADYAHGDKVATVAGGDPFAVSVGAEFVF
ncbi:hypothetical protein CEK62_06005 [Alcanivorax sp. N3-2A]|nr:hypothetical protein CEK62_06005 [Alcanivorax sp. N3-2A]